jgi:hypothetical protein
MLLGGAMAAQPLAAHAQQREPMRRIGVLMGGAGSGGDGGIGLREQSKTRSARPLGSSYSATEGPHQADNNAASALNPLILSPARSWALLCRAARHTPGGP